MRLRPQVLALGMALAVCACARTQQPAVVAPVPACVPIAQAPTREKPDRFDIMQSMHEIKSFMKACDNKGIVIVDIAFGSSGCPEEVSVRARGWKRTPEVIECLERAARAARVAPFKRERFKIRFPFRLYR